MGSSGRRSHSAHSELALSLAWRFPMAAGTFPSFTSGRPTLWPGISPATAGTKPQPPAGMQRGCRHCHHRAVHPSGRTAACLQGQHTPAFKPRPKLPSHQGMQGSPCLPNSGGAAQIPVPLTSPVPRASGQARGAQGSGLRQGQRSCFQKHSLSVMLILSASLFIYC